MRLKDRPEWLMTVPPMHSAARRAIGSRWRAVRLTTLDGATPVVPGRALRVVGLTVRDSCVRLVESQSEAQRGVDLLEFVKTHVADKLPETLGGNGGGLFGEYLGRFVTDGD